jgi:hypothetical protein
LTGSWEVPCGGQVIVRAWQNGLVVSEFPLSIGSGETWDGTISGLQSSVAYNVTAEVTIVNGCDSATLVTDPATVTPK